MAAPNSCISNTDVKRQALQ